MVWPVHVLLFSSCEFTTLDDFVHLVTYVNICQLKKPYIVNVFALKTMVNKQASAYMLLFQAFL